MKLTIGFLFFTAFLLLPQWGFCQAVGGTLQGHVASPSGEALSGALITALETGTGLSRSVKTDAGGFYRITELHVGRYQLTVTLQGFKTEVRSGLTVAIGQQHDIDFSLELAGVAEVVTVTEEAPIVERTKTSIGTTITNQQIDDLPLTDRSFTDLIFLSPGITPGTTEGSASKISGTGSSNASNTMYIDGVSNDQDSLGDFRGDFSPDAIREFQVLSSQYSAEYGQATGAVINVLTRSGTNDIHARISTYYRADSLAANNPFSTEKTPFNQTIFSSYLSGPIVKDKTFFFASYEHTFRNDTSVIAIDPALLAALGQPTDTSVPRPLRQPRLLFKLDHQLNQDQNLNFHYRFDRKHTDGLGIGDVGGGSIATKELGYNETVTDQDFVANHNWIVSNSKLNEARFQFARANNDESEVNCPGCPFIIRSSIYTGKYANFPQKFREDRYQFVDNFSFDVPNKGGDHFFKTGFDFSHVKLNAFVPNYFDGAFQFLTDQPFNASDPATFPFLYVQGTGNPNFNIDNNIYGLYFQDQWNVNRNFTLNLGIRYDYERHVSIRDDRNNFGPRLHFAWDPFKNGKTSVRGGYGRYYDQIFLNVPLIETVFQPGILTLNYILFPGYPDPHSGGVAIELPPTISILDPNSKTPSKDVVSIGFQRELAHDLALSADVVYAKGHNLLLLIDANAPVNGVRPNPNYGLIYDIQTVGHSDYKSLQLNMVKRFSDKYSLNVAYTLASSKANAFGSQISPTNQNDLNFDFGPTADDFRHTLSAAFLFDGPWGMKYGVRTTALSAPPYNITTGLDDNGDGNANDRPPGVGHNSARGAALWTVNVRVAKTFSIQKTQLEVLVEAFNLFNRTNPENFVGDMQSDLFGKPTGVFPGFEPRQIQLGFRLDF